MRLFKRLATVVATLATVFCLSAQGQSQGSWPIKGLELTGPANGGGYDFTNLNTVVAISITLGGVTRTNWPSGGGGAWGTITGTLSSQTDLWTELTNRYTKSEIYGLGFLTNETWTAVSNTVTAGAALGATALQSEVDTLQTVMNRGAIATNLSVTLGNMVVDAFGPALFLHSVNNNAIKLSNNSLWTDGANPGLLLGTLYATFDSGTNFGSYHRFNVGTSERMRLLAYGIDLKSGIISNAIWSGSNLLNTQITGLGTAATNNTQDFLSVSASNLFYSVANTSQYVTATITNDCYPSSNPSNFVTAAQTSGWVVSSHAGFVDRTITNGLASITYVDHATQGLVTASVTNGLASIGYVNAATNGLLSRAETNGWTVSSHAVYDAMPTNDWNAATNNALFASNGVVTLNGLTNSFNNMATKTNWAGAVPDGALDMNTQALTHVGSITQNVTAITNIFNGRIAVGNRTTADGLMHLSAPLATAPALIAQQGSDPIPPLTAGTMAVVAGGNGGATYGTRLALIGATNGLAAINFGSTTNDDNAYIRCDNALSNLVFGVDSTREAMRILSSGNVGINDSTPTVPLEVAGRVILSSNVLATSGTKNVVDLSNLNADSFLNIGSGYLRAGVIQHVANYAGGQWGACYGVVYDATTPGWEYICGGAADTYTNYGGSFMFDIGAGFFQWQNTSAKGTNGQLASTLRTVMYLDKAGMLGINKTLPTTTLDCNGDLTVRGAIIQTLATTTNTFMAGTNYFAGNVGIGTTNPAYRLTVQSAGLGTEALSINGTHTNTKFVVRETQGNAQLVRMFNTNLSEVVRISSDPGIVSWINNGTNFGIGTTEPDATLDINGGLIVRDHANFMGLTNDFYDTVNLTKNPTNTTQATSGYVTKLATNATAQMVMGVLDSANTTNMYISVNPANDNCSIWFGTSPSVAWGAANIKELRLGGLPTGGWPGAAFVIINTNSTLALQINKVNTPPSAVTNRASLWISNQVSAVMYTMNGAGANFKISPHNEDGDVVLEDFSEYEGHKRIINATKQAEAVQLICKYLASQGASQFNAYTNFVENTVIPLRDWRKEQLQLIDDDDDISGGADHFMSPLPKSIRQKQKIFDSAHPDWDVDKSNTHKKVKKDKQNIGIMDGNT